jgi:hypothetical protein
MLRPVAHDFFEDLWVPRMHPPFAHEELGFQNVPLELWQRLQDIFKAFEAASDVIDKHIAKKGPIS